MMESTIIEKNCPKKGCDSRVRFEKGRFYIDGQPDPNCPVCGLVQRTLLPFRLNPSDPWAQRTRELLSKSENAHKSSAVFNSFWYPYLSVIGFKRANGNPQSNSQSGVALPTAIPSESAVPKEEFSTLGIKDRKSNDIEIHHIIPRHAGGKDEKSNLVVLKTEDHVAIHFAAWLFFGRASDKCMVLWRVDHSSPEAAMAQKQVNREAREKAGAHERFKDKELQSLAGKIGGGKHSPAQLEHRALRGISLGAAYGRQVGMANASPELAEFLLKDHVWVHESGVSVKILSCNVDAFVDIIRILESYAPGQITKTKEHSFRRSFVTDKGHKARCGWEVTV